MDIKNKLRNKLTENTNRVQYCAVVLTEESRTLLMDVFAPTLWTVYMHHMTIAFGKSLGDLGLDEFEGKEAILKVTHIGESDLAVAVKVAVESPKDIVPKITTMFPHVTLFVDT